MAISIPTVLPEGDGEMATPILLILPSERGTAISILTVLPEGDGEMATSIPTILP